MKNQLKNMNNYAGVLQLKNGSKVNFGSIRAEGENFVHYTGKGLQEMFTQNGREADLSRSLKKLDEQSLIKSGHIVITPISDIASIH